MNAHELKINTADMEIWKISNQEDIPKLVASIPTRFDACRDAEG